MDNNIKMSSGGVGFFDVLLLINIVLKLVGVIDWSWWVVLWPLWISLAIVLGIIIFIIWYIIKK